MNRKLIGAAFVGSTLGLALAACQVEQPDPGCRVPHGFTNNMQLLLTPVEGQTLTGACAELHTMTVGIDEYVAPDLSSVKIAIVAEPVGTLFLEEEGNVTGTDIAVGDYMHEVPEDGICTAASTEEARIQVAAQTLEDGGTLAGRELAVKFENVRIYSTAEIPGTQATMDVLYEEDGCTGRYNAIGVYPPVSCENLDGEPDDRLCDIKATPTEDEVAEGIVPGCRVLIPGVLNECLNPTFVMTCDPGTRFCFPKELGLLRIE